MLTAMSLLSAWLHENGVSPEDIEITLKVPNVDTAGRIMTAAERAVPPAAYFQAEDRLKFRMAGISGRIAIAHDEDSA